MPLYRTPIKRATTTIPELIKATIREMTSTQFIATPHFNPRAAKNTALSFHTQK